MLTTVERPAAAAPSRLNHLRALEDERSSPNGSAALRIAAAARAAANDRDASEAVQRLLEETLS